MMQLRFGWPGRVLSCLAILIFLADSEALAQEKPAATLRLTQVVPRLPLVMLYALARDEDANPVTLKPAKLEAHVGSSLQKVSHIGDPGPIAIVFLVDISKSVKSQFPAIQKSVIDWIKVLNATDRVAILSLGEEVRRVADFARDPLDNSIKGELIKRVSELEAVDENTKLYEGIVQATDMSHRLDDWIPFRRVIVVLTDGVDDQTGGAGRQEAIDKLAIDPTPIYGIGVATRTNAEALKDFSALVRQSNGEYGRTIQFGKNAKTNDKNIQESYGGLKRIVDSVEYLEIKPCVGCIPDGSAVPVRLNMTEDSISLGSTPVVTVRLVNDKGIVPDEGAVRPPPPPPPPRLPLPPPPDPWWRIVLNVLVNIKTPLLWAIGLAVLASVGIAGTLAMLKKRRIETRSPPVVTRPPGAPPRTTSGDVAVLSSLVVTPATSPHTQRLRLYPLGQNDLAPIDVQFERKLLVGRSPDSEICIGNDGQVSAKHCTLAPDGKFILVQDNQSRNGTRINGVPINGAMHAEADAILGVGRTDLRIRLLPAGVR